MSSTATFASLEKEQIIHFLQNLQNKIISRFEKIETKGSFQKAPWDYQKGEGGGIMATLRGEVFEKAAVNWSGVQGDNFPAADGKGPFFATGVSLITHMRNPHAPTVHMNVRFMQTENNLWFGGGFDLTPMGFPYQEDTEHFHQVAKETLDSVDSNLYPEFSQNAKEYFYIPHRKKERGIGGIFFDHYWTGNVVADYTMWTKVGESFLDAIMPIYERRIHTPYSEEDRKLQTKMRAHYVEFNLIYDRGTRFGFQSGGNPEAILCSMPPIASW